jgi:nitrite reductase/ring-hydroxylating ferredoxin subunit
MTATFDTRRAICRLSDLADPDTRAFKIGSDDWPLRGFVVRKGNEVFAYLNRCPHAGHPLNWQENDFLTPDRTLLMCRSHGAQFDLSTGLCVAGPCPGAYLRPIPLQIVHDYILVGDDPDRLASLLL